MDDTQRGQGCTLGRRLGEGVDRRAIGGQARLLAKGRVFATQMHQCAGAVWQYYIGRRVRAERHRPQQWEEVQGHKSAVLSFLQLHLLERDVQIVRTDFVAQGQPGAEFIHRVGRLCAGGQPFNRQPGHVGDAVSALGLCAGSARHNQREISLQCTQDIPGDVSVARQFGRGQPDAAGTEVTDRQVTGGFVHVKRQMGARGH